MMLGPIL